MCGWRWLQKDPAEYVTSPQYASAANTPRNHAKAATCLWMFTDESPEGWKFLCNDPWCYDTFRKKDDLDAHLKSQHPDRLQV